MDIQQSFKTIHQIARQKNNTFSFTPKQLACETVIKLKIIFNLCKSINKIIGNLKGLGDVQSANLLKQNVDQINKAFGNNVLSSDIVNIIGKKVLQSCFIKDDKGTSLKTKPLSDALADVINYLLESMASALIKARSTNKQRLSLPSIEFNKIVSNIRRNGYKDIIRRAISANELNDDNPSLDGVKVAIKEAVDDFKLNIESELEIFDKYLKVNLNANSITPDGLDNIDRNVKGGSSRFGDPLDDPLGPGKTFNMGGSSRSQGSSSGSIIEVRNGAIVEVKEGAIAQVKEGAIMEVKEGSIIEVKEGAIAQVKEGAIAQVKEGAIAEVISGAIVEVKEGAIAQVKEGAIVEVNDGTIAEVKEGAIVEVKEGAIMEVKEESSRPSASRPSSRLGDPLDDPMGPGKTFNMGGSASTSASRASSTSASRASRPSSSTSSSTSSRSSASSSSASRPQKPNSGTRRAANGSVISGNNSYDDTYGPGKTFIMGDTYIPSSSAQKPNSGARRAADGSVISDNDSYYDPYGSDQTPNRNKGTYLRRMPKAGGH